MVKFGLNNGSTGAVLRDYIWLPANRQPAGLTRGDNDNLPQLVGGVPRSGEGVSPPDLPLAVIDGVNTATPATYQVHTDHLGRPVTCH
jgi:hypothetical protein